MISSLDKKSFRNGRDSKGKNVLPIEKEPKING